MSHLTTVKEKLTMFAYTGRSISLTVLLIAAPLYAASAAKTAIVYNFTGGSDGATPLSSLTEDTFGNVYGTSQQEGGNILCPQLDGCGTIFKLDKTGNLTSLFAFSGGADGRSPLVGVALIRGLLYGNSQNGTGPGSRSVLYSINTDGSNFNVLHDMTRADGENLAGLMQPSPGGGEFGVGEFGGADGDGTLFYLSATNAFAKIHDFAGGSDGQQPTYLIEDANHTLFGSTADGGGCATGKPSLKHGCGTIFEYVPKTRTYTVVYSFQDGPDGDSPLLGAAGPDGTLYGVSTKGGANGQGALFALTPGNNGYVFSVLSPIVSRYGGDAPKNPPALSPSGALVGATSSGGNYVYQNGQYRIYYTSPVTSPGQYLIPADRPDVFLGTADQGGTVGGTCALANGCGYIFYGRQ